MQFEMTYQALHVLFNVVMAQLLLAFTDNTHVHMYVHEYLICILQHSGDV